MSSIDSERHACRHLAEAACACVRAAVATKGETYMGSHVPHGDGDGGSDGDHAMELRIGDVQQLRRLITSTQDGQIDGVRMLIKGKEGTPLGRPHLSHA